MTLVPVDTTSALAVSDYLDKARQWLATAVEMTGPHEIANAKAEIATAAEATKQLGLSKDIQLDAQEMVRRAEYALGKAIRKGQDEGTVRTRGETGVTWDRWNGLQRETTSSTKPSATDFVPHHELAGEHGIRAMTDGVEPDTFSKALTDAKAEGNLSRANVVRKVKGQQQGPVTREQRADLIADLAAQGYTSRQMPDRVGVTEETVREIARAFSIEIPADRSSSRTRRINPALVVENTATALEGLAMGVEPIDCRDIDPALASQWVNSLTESMRALNRFVRQLKEQTQ